MSDIQRYESVYGAPDYDGDYVRHTDHIAALEAVKATDDECQYSKDVGVPEYRCVVRCQYGAGDALVKAERERCLAIVDDYYGGGRSFVMRKISDAAIVPSPALEANQQVIETLRAALTDMVRLADMGFEESLNEPEENGNFAAYTRAKSLLAVLTPPTRDEV